MGILIKTSILTFTILLTSCSLSDPKTFSTGEEVDPPYGCIEFRKRGGEC